MAPRKRKSSKVVNSNMSEKLVVEVEQRSVWSVFAGMVMVFLGILLVVVGVVALVLYRGEPKLDKTLPTPKLTVLPEHTSAHTLTIRGSVDKSIKRVAIYVNEKEVDGALWVDNGNFRYEYEVKDEGLYRIQASSVDGFPLRKRSEKSDIMAVNIDRKAPSKEVTLAYSNEVDTNSVKVTGSAEPLSTLVFTNADSKHVVKVEKDGTFSTTLPIAVGESTFDIEVRDEAGNSVKAENSIVVARISGSLNGNGATDGPDLPEASGELEAALAFMQGNKIMSTFGILAVLALILNSVMVAIRIKRYSI